MAMRIGDFLVFQGALTNGQVSTILTKQKEGDSRKFGEICLSLGYIEESELRKYEALLAAQ